MTLKKKIQRGPCLFEGGGLLEDFGDKKKHHIFWITDLQYSSGESVESHKGCYPVKITYLGK